MSNSSLHSYTPETLLHCATSSVRYYVGQFCKGAFSLEDTEDLIQDVMLKALSNASSYSPEKGAYSTWIGAIALNTVKSALYNQSRRKDFLNGYQEECSELSLQRSNETASDRAIRTEQAEEGLYSMVYSDRDRTILRMRSEGYGTGEIAKELAVKPSVVSLAVHHVKKRLGDAA